MRFRKRPIVIEAVQYIPGEPLPDWFRHDPDVFINNAGQWAIRTLEGSMAVSTMDWIIRGINGELYPCKPDIFAMTYEPADDIPDAESVAARNQLD